MGINAFATRNIPRKSGAEIMLTLRQAAFYVSADSSGAAAEIILTATRETLAAPKFMNKRKRHPLVSEASWILIFIGGIAAQPREHSWATISLTERLCG
jgi:hypothetical protein